MGAALAVALDSPLFKITAEWQYGMPGILSASMARWLYDNMTDYAPYFILKNMNVLLLSFSLGISGQLGMLIYLALFIYLLMQYLVICIDIFNYVFKNTCTIVDILFYNKITYPVETNLSMGGPFKNKGPPISILVLAGLIKHLWRMKHLQPKCEELTSSTGFINLWQTCVLTPDEAKLLDMKFTLCNLLPQLFEFIVELIILIKETYRIHMHAVAHYNTVIGRIDRR
ncbi:hypothetical protein ACJX0J_008569, partial [Zea mays]